MHGKFERYTQAGTPVETGNFVNNEKDGKWVFYDERGNEAVVTKFKAGKMLNIDRKQN